MAMSPEKIPWPLRPSGLAACYSLQTVIKIVIGVPMRRLAANTVANTRSALVQRRQSLRKSEIITILRVVNLAPLVVDPLGAPQMKALNRYSLDGRSNRPAHRENKRLIDCAHAARRCLMSVSVSPRPRVDHR